MAKCIDCEREFESVRSDARFCGSTCRNRYNRATDKLDHATDKYLDLEADLKLDLKKDLGVRAWSVRPVDEWHLGVEIIDVFKYGFPHGIGGTTKQLLTV